MARFVQASKMLSSTFACEAVVIPPNILKFPNTWHAVDTGHIPAPAETCFMKAAHEIVDMNRQSAQVEFDVVSLLRA